MSPTQLPRPPVALLLDFDGVIVDSVEIKVRAYSDVYAGEDPQLLRQIDEYQILHGGVTRRDKFAHFERTLFGRPADDATLDRLAAAYREHVYEAVLACRFIDGAEAFLEHAHGHVDMHLISGTPRDELVDIVTQRGLAHYFDSVHGAPAKKPAAFAQIVASRGYDPARTVAVGDSITEYLAARDLGIPFLGIIPAGWKVPFPAEVPVLPTLAEAGALLGIVRD